jgi:hypothetical protein
LIKDNLSRKFEVNNPEKQPASWSFEEGVLSVQDSGTTVSLGRYATYELAAKAAALYLAKLNVRTV